MKFASFYKLLPFCLISGILSFSSTATATDADDLKALLHEFLGAAEQMAAHRRFWADDLVYTSSNGTRTDKAEILAGFDERESTDEVPAVVYSGEDVDVRVYGATAVIAFRLVGEPGDGSQALHYFNTGTFVRRDGLWQAVAWQATKILPTQDSGD